MKRIIAVLLSAMLLLPLFLLSASAETTELTDEQGLTYTLSEDGTYYIVSDFDESVTEVVIPSTYDGLPVKEIGNSAFYDCISLRSIVLPNSATGINAYAFYKCSNLTNILLPDSLTFIETHAFAWCSSLEEIVIPDSVFSIGVSTFIECAALKYVTIPDSLKSIGADAFTKCDNLNYNQYDNGLYLGNESNPYYALIKPSSTDIYNCDIDENTKVIAGKAFYSCENLSRMTIPDSVYSICDGAFYNCTYLSEVSIGNSVTMLEGSVFRNCTNLTDLEIPDSVISIGHDAFYDCDSLYNITIPSSVVYISPYAFNRSDISFIYCEAPSKPRLWDDNWLGTCKATVKWLGTESNINYEYADNVEIEIDIRAENSFESGTTISVEQSTEIPSYNGTMFDVLNNVLAVTVGANRDGKLVIPFAPYQMYIKKPENYGNEVAVFHRDESGNITEAESEFDIISGFITVSTDKLGTYFLVDTEGVELTTTGDINGNGEIDSLDYILLKRAYFGTFQLSDTAESAGDINGNGEIDSLDYILLKRAYFGTYEIK